MKKKDKYSVFTLLRSWILCVSNHKTQHKQDIGSFPPYLKKQGLKSTVCFILNLDC